MLTSNPGSETFVGKITSITLKSDCTISDGFVQLINYEEQRQKFPTEWNEREGPPPENFLYHFDELAFSLYGERELGLEVGSVVAFKFRENGKKGYTAAEFRPYEMTNSVRTNDNAEESKGDGNPGESDDLNSIKESDNGWQNESWYIL